ncbi:MAG TPA: hypothetical protein VIM09_09765 [Chthoniobacterales bacterium]|jgi:hypothetical protein
MMFGLSVVGFIVALCFAAGFLFAMRAGKTRTQVFFLGILFGIVFLIALSGLAVAGCIAVLATSH